MRISTHMMQQSALRKLGGTLSALARAQDEAATGRRVGTVSDDPVDASQIMRLGTHLRDIEQFNRNAASATTRLSAEDVALTSARGLMQRAKELAMSGATQSPSDPLRLAALSELQRIKDELVAIGNTKVGNEYIFAGANSTTPPFLATGAYVGDSTPRQVEIDQTVVLDTNHTGNQMFSPALGAVDSLITQLQTGTPDDVLEEVSGLETNADAMLTLQTEVGSRLLEIKTTTEGLARRSAGLEDRMSAIRDVDPAEAVLKVVTAQQALERAYAVIGKVLSTNLLDYLR